MVARDCEQHRLNRGAYTPSLLAIEDNEALGVRQPPFGAENSELGAMMPWVFVLAR
jgi:hypothetical protein